jgi:hypothetical protein
LVKHLYCKERFNLATILRQFPLLTHQILEVPKDDK